MWHCMMMTRLHKAIGDMLFSNIYKRDGLLKTYSLVSQEVTITLLRWTMANIGNQRPMIVVGGFYVEHPTLAWATGVGQSIVFTWHLRHCTSL